MVKNNRLGTTGAGQQCEVHLNSAFGKPDVVRGVQRVESAPIKETKAEKLTTRSGCARERLPLDLDTAKFWGRVTTGATSPFFLVALRRNLQLSFRCGKTAQPCCVRACPPVTRTRGSLNFAAKLFPDLTIISFLRLFQYSLSEAIDYCTLKSLSVLKALNRSVASLFDGPVTDAFKAETPFITVQYSSGI